MLIRNIPNAITSLNLVAGLCAIIFAYEGDVSHAVLAIVVAVILDTLDGRVARMLGVNGEFGKELDSLADVVTFGAAPSFLVYVTTFQEMGIWGVGLAGVFTVCGALRLARFNTATHKVPNHFIGLPITAAGTVLALFAMHTAHFDSYFLSGLVLILSFLMISNLRVPNFKRFRLPRHFYIVTPLMALVMYALSQLFPSRFPLLLLVPIAIFLVFIVYRMRSGSLNGKYGKNRKDGGNG